MAFCNPRWLIKEAHIFQIAIALTQAHAHAFHGQKIFRSRDKNLRAWKVEQQRGLVSLTDETFHRIVEPVCFDIALRGHLRCRMVDFLLGGKDSINIFGGQARPVRKHHGRTSVDSNFTDQVALDQRLGKF